MSPVAVSVLGDSQGVRLVRVGGGQQSTTQQWSIEHSVAHGGWTTQDLKCAIRNQVSVLKPTCIIFIGINDIFKSIAPEKTKINIKTIIRLLKSHNKTIYITTLPPTLHTPHIQPKIKSLNIFIQSLNNPPSIQSIKFHKLFPPFAPMNLSLYNKKYRNGKPDNVHLSSAGFKQLVRHISPRVDDLLPTPPAPLHRQQLIADSEP